jgi:hypothetical protein
LKPADEQYINQWLLGNAHKIDFLTKNSVPYSELLNARFIPNEDPPGAVSVEFQFQDPDNPKAIKEITGKLLLTRDETGNITDVQDITYFDPALRRTLKAATAGAVVALTAGVPIPGASSQALAPMAIHTRHRKVRAAAR